MRCRAKGCACHNFRFPAARSSDSLFACILCMGRGGREGPVNSSNNYNNSQAKASILRLYPLPPPPSVASLSLSHHNHFAPCLEQCLRPPQHMHKLLFARRMPLAAKCCCNISPALLIGKGTSVQTFDLSDY